MEANDLRAELNAWFLRQTDSKLRTYVSIMALVEGICFGFITQRPTPQISSNCGAGLNKLAKSKRRDETGESAPARPLKRVKREPMDS